MAELTKRELHRRLAAARGELAAMLFFRLPGKKARKHKRYSKRQYEADRDIKELAYLLGALFDGDFQTQEGDCGGCGKPIRGGQLHVHTEDAGNFHYPRCMNVHKRFVHRAETQREQDRDARKRLKEARAYLKERGLIA